MTQLTIDQNVASQLQDKTDVVEICDPNGKVIGRFIPALDLSKWEILGPELSEEELQKREQESKSYSTSEVLAHLERLQ